MLLQPRPYNFAAGPAALPAEVLELAAAEMLDWHGCGMSVMEMSHRGREFMSIRDQAEQDLRELLSVPVNYHVLFMQGGGIAENAIVPMNLAKLKPQGMADFVVTGSWSQKSHREAQRYCDAHVIASNEAQGPDNHTTMPPVQSWAPRPDISYLHICGNETIHGIEFHELPDLKALGCDAPLAVDCSSNVLSRPVDWSRVGLAYAGAQKNIGAAGVTIVIVREDLVGRALPICPSAFDYKLVADNQSMYNTPPTYAIYIAGLVFQWLKRQGGVPEMERRAVEKAGLLYNCIDGSSGFYVNRVAKDCRSRMNVPFFLHDERLNDAFLAGAKERGLLQLKGHKLVGGIRASLFNAMPVAGVQALVAYMREFAAEHG